MSTDDSSAADRGSEFSAGLGPLVAGAIAEARTAAYGDASAANELEGDYGTWEDWAALVRRVAEAAQAAERERWRTAAQLVLSEIDALPHDMRRYVTGSKALLDLVEWPNAKLTG